MMFEVPFVFVKLLKHWRLASRLQNGHPKVAAGSEQIVRGASLNSQISEWPALNRLLLAGFWRSTTPLTRVSSHRYEATAFRSVSLHGRNFIPVWVAVARTTGHNMRPVKHGGRM